MVRVLGRLLLYAGNLPNNDLGSLKFGYLLVFKK